MKTGLAARDVRRADLLGALGVAAEAHEWMMSTTELHIEDSWAVMGVDFEGVIQHCFGDAYVDLDEAAKATSPGTAGKPLRARTVAYDLPLEPGHLGADVLRTLVARLSGHTLG
jgi:hypothetical protein